MNVKYTGYEHLQAVFTAAMKQAAVGKGKERHANGRPFHDQRMQRISTLLDSPDGMAFQVIKKLTEGLQFECAERREAELLGAINYLAGIVVWLRCRGNPVGEEAITPDWDAAPADATHFMPESNVYREVWVMQGVGGAWWYKRASKPEMAWKEISLRQEGIDRLIARPPRGLA